ncbi:hypothetical protein N7476_003604 [Penicillium atrosanguineum]|uniref:Uncharacterized protein n=1 Tax=Penicillium atrosanguineum TaxID=1132637 RepID=A0A9W9Q5Z1_9EURO|nr:hypothetical protein N7476_003604 [Penicillium atrosanguineum]
MVKTTYALTVFVAMSLAAPLPPAGNDVTGIIARDGTGNFIGAGTADGAVNEMIKGLATPKNDQPATDDKMAKMGKKAAAIKAADEKKKEKKPVVTHSALESLPLLGPLLRPVPLKRDNEARSFTGDLSNLPLLGSLFGGDQNHPANSPHQTGGGQKVGMRRSHHETVFTILDNEGFPQNHGQNHGQNYGQNYGQNAGQNAHQNEGQNAGQNYGQNHGQNEGQNYGQNEGQNMEKRGGPPNNPDSLGALWLIRKLTSGGSITKGHKRSEDLPTSPGAFHSLIGEGEGAATDAAAGALSAAADIMPIRRDSSDGGDIADSVSDALDNGIDASTDAADMAMPVRRDLGGLSDLTASLTAGKNNKDQAPPTPGQSKSQPQADQYDKKNDPLAQLASESGLGKLFAGNAHHGLGIFPMNGRRDVHENEARGESPIQGSDLESVLFSGGVLNKLAHTLTPSAPAAAPAAAAPAAAAPAAAAPAAAAPASGAGGAGAGAQ